MTTHALNRGGFGPMFTRYTQKLGLSIGIPPLFLGDMTVAKIQETN
jgi:hypothetical protein